MTAARPSAERVAGITEGRGGAPTRSDSQSNWSQVIFKGLQLKGIYGREMFETWYKMTTMVQGGLNVAPVITHHFRAEQFEEAFAIMEEGQSGKIILDWN